MKNGDRFTCEIKGLSGGVLSVKLKYVDGTIAIQWSQVAKLQSDRLFLVKTESGEVYTGTMSTTGASDDPPIEIEIAEAPGKEVEVAQRKIINLSQTSEGFWHRFDGAVNTGLLYSKGNESLQYSFSSQIAYTRERWASQVNFNSSFASITVQTGQLETRPTYTPRDFCAGTTGFMPVLRLFCKARCRRSIFKRHLLGELVVT
jgi:hypothetical protein